LKIYLILGVLLLFLVSCTPKEQQAPFVPIGAVIPEPIKNPEPDVKAQNQVIVNIRSPSFPVNFTAKVGNEIVWVNGFDQPFMVIGKGNDEFASGFIKPGKSFVHVYNQSGDYVYILTPGKDGVITIVD
jgi:plastocyanin